MWAKKDLILAIPFYDSFIYQNNFKYKTMQLFYRKIKKNIETKHATVTEKNGPLVLGLNVLD